MGNQQGMSEQDCPQRPSLKCEYTQAGGSVTPLTLSRGVRYGLLLREICKLILSKINNCKKNNISLLRIPYWEIENNSFKNKIISEVNRQNQVAL